MLSKKSPLISNYDPSFRKQLEYLYARRSVIDTLIESLEQYDRDSPKTAQILKRKSA